MDDFFVLHRMLGADAQFDMAIAYTEGVGRNRNLGLAVTLFRAAADKGHGAAQFNLGCCYDAGIGLQADNKRAAYWYLQAAKQGHMLAEYNLALCFDNGLGVPQDSAEANRWYRKAADRGHPPAQFAIAINLEEGRGFQRDIERAVFWYKKSLDHAKRDHSLTRAVLSQIQARVDYLKRQIENSQKPKPETVTCRRCKKVIRYSVMTAHMSEAHGNRPDKHKSRIPRTKPRRIVKPKPVPAVVTRTQSTPSSLPAKALRECLCPRCGGDGGVRGGCSKCEGTGWVAASDARQEPYRPDHSRPEDRLISNANYQESNSGGHYRDSTGRFGSSPLHDDYGEEGLS